MSGMSEKAAFEWTNGQIKNALDAITEVCAPENRFPIVTSIRAYRNHKRLAEAWESADQERSALIREHGVEKDGTFHVLPDSDGYPAFVEGYTEIIQMNGQALELEILSLAEIEKGYVRDPETGRKTDLGVSPGAIGVLMELNVVTEDGKAVETAEEGEGEALERDEAQEDAPE